MGLRRVGHVWATKLNWTELKPEQCLPQVKSCVLDYQRNNHLHHHHFHHHQQQQQHYDYCELSIYCTLVGGYAKQWKYFINTTLSSIIISVLHTRTLKLKASWYKVVNDTDKNTRVTSVYDKVYSQIPKAAGFPRCSKDPTETRQRHINSITHLQFNQVCFPSLHWKLKLKTFQQVPGVDEMFQLSLHRALGQASGCQVNERRNSGSELSLQRELNCSLNRGRGGQKFSSI